METFASPFLVVWLLPQPVSPGVAGEETVWQDADIVKSECRIILSFFWMFQKETLNLEKTGRGYSIAESSWELLKSSYTCQGIKSDDCWEIFMPYI